MSQIRKCDICGAEVKNRPDTQWQEVQGIANVDMIREADPTRKIMVEFRPILQIRTDNGSINDLCIGCITHLIQSTEWIEMYKIGK